jgi:hypothetical protein
VSVLSSTSQIYCGIKKGSVWGTEVAVTGAGSTALTPSSLQLSDSFADFLPRDVGQGFKRTSQARLQRDCSFSLGFDVTYDGGWIALLAAFMGTESNPAETTGSQGDYSDNIDLADSTFGTFWSLAWMIETDRVMAIPSFKPVGFTYTHAVNGAGTITFQCMGDRSLVSSATTAGNLSGLTAYTYETATLGGTNHYFRINSQGGSGLASGDAVTAIGWTMSLTRPHKPLFGLRGASTQYTLEPRQSDPLDGTFKLDFTEVDDATLDMMGQWTNATKLKAEIFYDGSQIAAGVNRSFKWQMPYVQPTGAIPTGHDWANNNSLMQPSYTLRMLKATAAPTGMTGVTDLLRVVPIWNTKSTRWSA